MARLKLGLRNLSISEIIMKGNLILYSMQGNTYLPPNPTPSLESIATCLAELKAAAGNAADGARVQILERDIKKEQLLILLRRLGGWISIQTTNYAAIESTGFDYVKTKSGEIKMQKPTSIRKIFDSNTNILKIIWTPVPGAKQYLVEMNQNGIGDEAQWTLAAYTSQAKYSPKPGEIKPLTRYYYRVRALGTTGIGPASGIVSGAIF